MDNCWGIAAAADRTCAQGFPDPGVGRSCGTVLVEDRNLAAGYIGSLLQCVLIRR